jgi:hypothetical protein
LPCLCCFSRPTSPVAALRVAAATLSTLRICDRTVTLHHASLSLSLACSTNATLNSLVWLTTLTHVW